MKKVYIGQNLKRILAALSLKKAQIARTIDCSTGYLSDIEADKKSPGVDFLSSLYREYGVDVNFLITGKGEMFIGNVSSIHQQAALPDIEQTIESSSLSYKSSITNKHQPLDNNLGTPTEDKLSGKKTDRENRRQEAIEAGARAIKNVYHATDLTKLVEGYRTLKQENEHMAKQIEELRIRLDQTERLFSLMSITTDVFKDRKESQ